MYQAPALSPAVSGLQEGQKWGKHQKFGFGEELMVENGGSLLTTYIASVKFSEHNGEKKIMLVQKLRIV